MKPYFETKLGKLYNCDCLELTNYISNNSVDLIVTSPPYNQQLTTQNKSMVLYSDNMHDDAYIKFIQSVFSSFNSMLKQNGSIFYNYKSDTKKNIVKPAFMHLIEANRFTQFHIVGEIVWKYAGDFDSAKTRFHIDYEMVYHLAKTNIFNFYGKRDLTSVWKINHVMHGTKEKENTKTHPCPFPEALVTKIITHTTKDNDLVFDPFCGSGTTAVVCERNKRQWVCAEKNNIYCDIIAKRIDNETKQRRLF